MTGTGAGEKSERFGQPCARAMETAPFSSHHDDVRGATALVEAESAPSPESWRRSLADLGEVWQAPDLMAIMMRTLGTQDIFVTYDLLTDPMTRMYLLPSNVMAEFEASQEVQTTSDARNGVGVIGEHRLAKSDGEKNGALRHTVWSVDQETGVMPCHSPLHASMLSLEITNWAFVDSALAVKAGSAVGCKAATVGTAPHSFLETPQAASCDPSVTNHLKEMVVTSKLPLCLSYADIEPTSGWLSDRDSPLTICFMYSFGKCTGGQYNDPRTCHQIHVKREVLERLRRRYVNPQRALFCRTIKANISTQFRNVLSQLARRKLTVQYLEFKLEDVTESAGSLEYEAQYRNWLLDQSPGVVKTFFSPFNLCWEFAVAGCCPLGDECPEIHAAVAEALAKDKHVRAALQQLRKTKLMKSIEGGGTSPDDSVTACVADSRVDVVATNAALGSGGSWELEDTRSSFCTMDGPSILRTVTPPTPPVTSNSVAARPPYPHVTLNSDDHHAAGSGSWESSAYVECMPSHESKRRLAALQRKEMPFPLPHVVQATRSQSDTSVSLGEPTRYEESDWPTAALPLNQVPPVAQVSQHSIDKKRKQPLLRQGDEASPDTSTVSSLCLGVNHRQLANFTVAQSPYAQPLVQVAFLPPNESSVKCARGGHAAHVRKSSSILCATTHSLL